MDEYFFDKYKFSDSPVCDWCKKTQSHLPKYLEKWCTDAFEKDAVTAQLFQKCSSFLWRAVHSLFSTYSFVTNNQQSQNLSILFFRKSFRSRQNPEARQARAALMSSTNPGGHSKRYSGGLGVSGHHQRARSASPSSAAIAAARNRARVKVREILRRPCHLILR